MVRYRGRQLRRYFRADAAFAAPEVYEFLEAEGFLYAIRLPANPVLQASISHLLKRPVGRPPNQVRRYYASFSYQAGSWSTKRRVVAKVEWHPGELCPRIGYIVTNMARPAERVVAFYNQRGTAEQHIREGKNAVKWTRLSCRTFRNNAVRLQLHALAYNLANFMRTLALPDQVAHWSLTTLREKLVKIGARIVRHGRYVVFQLEDGGAASVLRRDPAPNRAAQTTAAADPGMSTESDERRQAEVSAPMSDREPPNAAETPGPRPKAWFCATTRLVPAFTALPSALERRKVGLQQPTYGKCRFRCELLHTYNPPSFGISRKVGQIGGVIVQERGGVPAAVAPSEACAPRSSEGVHHEQKAAGGSRKAQRTSPWDEL